MDHKDMAYEDMDGCTVHGSRIRPVAGHREHGNKHSGLIKCGDVLTT